MDLTPEEKDLIIEHRKKREYLRGYNEGLETAAKTCESWAAESCGGSGEGGHGYKNLAAIIRDKKRPAPTLI